MAVQRYKLTNIDFGIVSVTPPVVSAQNVATTTVSIPGLSTADKILLMMQEGAQKEAIPVAAYCETDGVLTIQFANITSGTATTTAKTFLWTKIII